MSDSPEEPTQKPTTSEAEAEAEGDRMAKHWLSIAVVSIGLLVLIVLGMLQWAGLTDLFAPVADTEGGQWAVFAVLVLILAGLAAWSWNSV